MVQADDSIDHRLDSGKGGRSVGVLIDRTDWLIFIWVGAGIGLLFGLLLEVISQIDKAHEKRIRDWTERARKDPTWRSGV